MELKAGYTYFIADEFFNKVNDPFLKTNYETDARPHYYSFCDPATSLYWFVPISSKTDKFERIIQNKRAKHKPTDAIKIVKIQDQKRALLFQDMFPVLEKYITGAYIRGGQPYRIADPKIVQELEKNAQKIIRLLRRGVKFTPTQPDVMLIERLMVAEQQEVMSEKLPDKKVSLADTISAAKTEAERRNDAKAPEKTPETDIEK